MDYSRREEGYALLGEYLEGPGNTQGQAFTLSQPVVISYHPDGRKVMHMYVGTPLGGPASAASSAGGGLVGRMQSLPAPRSERLRLSIAGGEVVAAAWFEGYITPVTAAAARARLLAALQRDGVQLAQPEAEGFFRIGQYGAVYTLEMRQNEILMRCKL